MNLVLNPVEQNLTSEALTALDQHLKHLLERLQSIVGSEPMSLELSEFHTLVKRLQERIHPTQMGTVRFDFNKKELGVLRSALSFHRRISAEDVERRRRHLISPSISRQLEDGMKPIDSLLENEGLRSIWPFPVPSLANFITAEGRSDLFVTPELSQEERDQKHRILLSSGLIIHDVGVFRRNCEDREVPFAVVFADLDDFKQFNSELGEVAVDRQILPRILLAVENSSYGHGRAYRHGGDEFVLLVPNATVSIITSIVGEVKQAVERLSFDSTKLVPKLSAGVWITIPNSHLTANELIEKASQAKSASKSAGKSRITIRLEAGSHYTETIAD